MRSIPCPFSELSASLQAKTLYHHTIKGLVRTLTVQPSHPLDLPFLLGLSGKVTWYTTGTFPLDKYASMAMLRTVATFTDCGLDGVDFHAISTRLRQFPAIVQKEIAHRVEWYIVNYKFLNRAERFNMQPASMFPKIEKSVYDRLEQHLADLEAALLTKDPLMSQHLRSSHAMLITYPETIHLLDDADTSKLIDAAEIHTKTEIVKASATGKGAGAGTGRKKVSIADL